MQAIGRAEPEQRKELIDNFLQNKSEPKPRKVTRKQQDDAQSVSKTKIDHAQDIEVDDEEDTDSTLDIPYAQMTRAQQLERMAQVSKEMEHSKGNEIDWTEDMLFEMDDALQDMVWRWNKCAETYPMSVQRKEGKEGVKMLIHKC